MKTLDDIAISSFGHKIENKKIDFFKSEDFEESWDGCFPDYEMCADMANKKLERALGPKVYWTQTNIGAWREMGRANLEESNYTARLFDIQEIKKECEHKIIHTMFKPNTSETIIRCGSCNETLKSKGWEIVCPTQG